MLSVIPSQSQAQGQSSSSRGRRGPVHVDEVCHIAARASRVTLLTEFTDNEVVPL